MTAIEEKSKQNNGVGHRPSTVPVGSSQNDSRTDLKSGTPLTQPRSRPVRYRLILPSGHPSPAFKPKPGELGKLLAEAFPGQDELELVEA